MWRALTGPPQAFVATEAKTKSKGAALTRRAHCREPRFNLVARLLPLNCSMRTQIDACPEQALVAGKSKNKRKARRPRAAHFSFRSHFFDCTSLTGRDTSPLFRRAQVVKTLTVCLPPPN